MINREKFHKNLTQHFTRLVGIKIKYEPHFFSQWKLFVVFYKNFRSISVDADLFAIEKQRNLGKFKALGGKGKNLKNFRDFPSFSSFNTKSISFAVQ